MKKIFLINQQPTGDPYGKEERPQSCGILQRLLQTKGPSTQ
ncbi:hypothetical protein [Aeromonas salmonicida]